MSFFAEGGFFKQSTYHISKLQSGAICNYAVMMLTGLTLYVVLHEDLVNNDRRYCRIAIVPAGGPVVGPQSIHLWFWEMTSSLHDDLLPTR